MLRSYLTIAFRNIIRGRLYSAINILGLAIGLACFFLIVLYIKDEWSYDRFHKKSERIFRVVELLNLDGSGEQSSSCPFPVAPALMNDYPHLIEASVRFFNFQDPQHTLRVDDRKFNESRLFVADSNVFEVFDFALLRGDKHTVLDEPNSIVLTDQLAKKYFGNEDPIGRIIHYDGGSELKVTGILAPIPVQSHIHFDGLISFSSLRTMLGPGLTRNWVWNPNWTYVLLKEGVNASDLEQVFPDFINKYYPEFLKPQVKHLLQPVTDIHLHSRYSYEIEPNNDVSTLYIFSVIGIFILLIACVNFMNLSTARSAARAKEVGVRKVVGANRSQLVYQFLSESLLLSFVSVLISLVIAELLLPLFNSISGKGIELNYFANLDVLYVIIGAGFFTGIVSGAYPAFYLSAFQPVNVLRGKLSSAGRNIGLRKVLVVFQFTISVALIVSTGVVYSQLHFLQSADLGFNKERVLLLPVRPPMAKSFDALITELRGSKQVMHVATMNDVIGKHHNTHEYNFEGMQRGKWIYFPSLIVDEEFLPATGIQVLAGRNFSKAFPRDDSLAVIVNESMVRHMKWGSPQDAIGKQLYTPGGNEKVIGVVKDFHFVSLLNPVGPFVLDMTDRQGRSFWIRYITVKLKDGELKTALADIEKIWNNHYEEFPFEYLFLEDDLREQYKAEENLGKLITYFSMLAILIACLGLFALATYSAGQRTKEIGIRKVMGASVKQIVMLLSRDFLKLVFISIVIACPFSWYFLQEWLKGFAYRVDLNPLLFALAGLITIFIALITVSLRAVQAATANPVNSLRYE